MTDWKAELDKWTTIHRIEPPAVEPAPQRAQGRTDEEHEKIVNRNRQQRMERIDRLPADVRALVHEYGWHIVDTCMTLGVCKPRQIRHLVETILEEMSPTRGAHSQQGIRTEIVRGAR